MKALLITACLVIVTEQLLAESVNDANQRLPRCDIVLNKLEVMHRSNTTVITVSAELANKTKKQFNVDIAFLAAALHNTTFTDKDRVKYEIQPRDEIDGSLFREFYGDRLLRPMTTNIVTLQLLAGKEGLVAVNRDFLHKEFSRRHPTNLTYEVFGVIWQSSDVRGYLAEKDYSQEMLISGYGKVTLDWRGVFPK
jgi:hypothetical protein